MLCSKTEKKKEFENDRFVRVGLDSEKRIDSEKMRKDAKRA